MQNKGWLRLVEKAKKGPAYLNRGYILAKTNTPVMDAQLLANSALVLLSYSAPKDIAIYSVVLMVPIV